jgi:flagellin
MSMIINHNIAAMNTYNNLSANSTQLSKSLQKLSSGLRINSASDDASGLTISQQMQGQINGLNQATSNAQNDTSLIQTADGALSQTGSILQSMRTLAVQSADDTNTSTDRVAMQNQVDQLAKEITRIATTTQFNNMVLMSGAHASSGFNFQIGANASQTISMTIGNMTASTLKVSGSGTGFSAAGGISISTQSAASSAITTIDAAIATVSAERAKYGAFENRLSDTVSNLQNISQNLSSASSQITDVNMAQEMMNYSKLNIINQSATAMLAQANQLPQGVLKLLQ